LSDNNARLANAFANARQLYLTYRTKPRLNGKLLIENSRAIFSRQLTETLANAKGTPEELRELAREEREQLQHWTEAERDLWQSWFNAIREINFRPEPGAAAHAGRDLVQLWQESAHKMIDAQASLVRRWTGGISGTKKQG
jgi:hypothetical protein